MIRFVTTTTAVAAFVAGPVLAQSSSAEENKLDMAEVPPAAMDAALVEAEKHGVTNAEFSSVALDGEIYEFQTTASSGMALEIDVMEDGSIDEVEEEIAMDDVPSAVSEALDTELAGFEPARVERSTRSDGAIVYEFEGTNGGAEIDVEINEDGTGFVMNEDSAA